MSERLLSPNRPDSAAAHPVPFKQALEPAPARTKPRSPHRARAHTTPLQPHGCIGAALILIAITVLDVGCATSPNTSFADPFVVQPAGDEDEHWYASLAGKYHRPVDQLNDLHDAWHDSQNTPEQRRAIRAQFAYELLSIIDEYHENYKIQLHTAVAAGNTLFDTAILGLSTAGSVLTGDGSGRFINAAVGALSGTRLAVNQNFLNERTTAAIIAQMDALRHEKKAQIIERVHRRTIDEYPLPAVEQDLLDYFYRGSIVNALTALAEDAAVRKSQARQTLDDLYDTQGMDAPPE